MIFLVSTSVFFEITIIFARRLGVNAAKAEEEGVEGARFWWPQCGGAGGESGDPGVL